MQVSFLHLKDTYIFVVFMLRVYTVHAKAISLVYEDIAWKGHA